MKKQPVPDFQKSLVEAQSKLDNAIAACKDEDTRDALDKMYGRIDHFLAAVEKESNGGIKVEVEIHPRSYVSDTRPIRATITVSHPDVGETIFKVVAVGTRSKTLERGFTLRGNRNLVIPLPLTEKPGEDEF